ncbi:LINE-1 retrotransposable element ORF2 protein [Camelus dromedarius]|uniref:LINE-1 retrotransposable element ORF2 protein n=1 Tax=Camelus dromedarius TaxID=9838 RepID=A0A5N4EI20_CAMDR|nr:LINE-1 retrotransposable element ORF2 protein [Camelus dromedarius]
MFIAALYTIAKTWKQPKCPSTDNWIKKLWYIYTMEYYSAIEKNKIMPFAATWMDPGPEIIILKIGEASLVSVPPSAPLQSSSEPHLSCPHLVLMRGLLKDSSPPPVVGYY